MERHRAPGLGQLGDRFRDDDDLWRMHGFTENIDDVISAVRLDLIQDVAEVHRIDPMPMDERCQLFEFEDVELAVGNVDRRDPGSTQGYLEFPVELRVVVSGSVAGPNPAKVRPRSTLDAKPRGQRDGQERGLLAVPPQIPGEPFEKLPRVQLPGQDAEPRSQIGEVDAPAGSDLEVCTEDDLNDQKPPGRGKGILPKGQDARYLTPFLAEGGLQGVESLRGWRNGVDQGIERLRNDLLHRNAQKGQ